MNIWKPVPGFEDVYAVSDDGRVKRTAKGGAAIVGKELSTQLDKCGYVRVRLMRNYKPTRFKMHRLVASVFLGPVGDSMTVNHKNGVRDDNRVENLEIVSRAENIAHSFRALGRTHAGSSNPKSKLSEEQVIEIRARVSNGERQADLMSDYGVTKYTLSDICRRKTWTHV